MANESQSRGRGPDTGAELGNPRSKKRRPTGVAVSRQEERSGRVGGEGNVSQQSNDGETDGGAPSTQTSSAQDEQGQV